MALSTGSDFYTIDTVYNGYNYIVKVFNKSVVSVNGAQSFVDDVLVDNKAHVLSDGYILYGTPTDELNRTTISVPVLRRDKPGFIEAVKTQLLYFKDITFNIVNYTGSETDVSFLANTFYNTEHLILSDRSPYSKPHIVIVKGGEEDLDKQVGVCYGYLDYEELELEDMNGNIGIKCSVRQVVEEDGETKVITEGVTVTPSREKVVWDAATREYLMKKFSAAQDEANTLIEKEIATTDFVDWLTKCKSINNYGHNNNTILGRLSKIVDLKGVRPRFNKSSLNYGPLSIIFKGFKVERKYRHIKDGKPAIVTSDVLSWTDLDFKKLYLKTESSNRVKDLYIDSLNDTFMVISPINAPAQLLDVAAKVKTTVDKLQSHQSLILQLLSESVDAPKSYDDVEIPDTFRDSLKVKDDKADAETAERELTPAEKRKLEDRIVCNTFKYRPGVWGNKQDDETYQRDKREPKVGEIQNYSGLLYYGHVEDLSRLHFACSLLDSYLQKYDERDRFYNEEYRIIIVAQNQKKHYKNHRHINDFFGKEVNGKIEMDNAVVQWNTARKIKDVLPSMLFLKNFKVFSESLNEDYLTLTKYVETSDSDLNHYSKRFGIHAHYSDFLHFLDTIEVVQKAAQRLKDKEITQEDFSRIVGDNSLSLTVKDTLAVDMEILNKVDELVAKTQDLTLLNYIPELTTEQDLPSSLSQAIDEYLQFKKFKVD